MPKNRAKGVIVATLGPSSDKKETLEKMITEGLDVVRLNMSHGTHDDLKRRYDLVREVDDMIPILLDLSGPKIRIGNMEKSVMLRTGNDFTLTKKTIVGNQERATVLYKELIDFSEIDNHIFLNDGLIELNIVEKKKDEVRCKVINGGQLSSRKGVNAPDIPINLYSPTKKDIKDLDFTVNLEPDFYSVSFVRRKGDLEKVREIIANHTNEKIPLISKIEHKDAIRNIVDIVQFSDGIMVARGDLGVEIPPQDVPLIQRELISMCNEANIPCIVATQMLESMVISPRPTRAETSDVANAILQGSDAVMLSAETATGNYPIEAVSMMDKIIVAVQSSIKQKSSLKFSTEVSVAESIGRASVSLASGLKADYLIAFTRTGLTATLVSKFKPNQTIIAITSLQKTARRLRLKWAILPLLVKHDYHSTDEMIHSGIMEAYKSGLIERQSNCVIIAGSLLGLPSSTNNIQFIRSSDIISSLEATKKFAQAYSLE